MGEKYYPWLFLDHSKYNTKENNITRYITDDLQISSDNFEKENSYEEI